MQIHRKSVASFTLVELLVVISIIGLLAGLAVPAIFRGVEKGKETKKLAKLKQIFDMNQSYIGDNNGRTCPMQDGDGQHWMVLLSPYANLGTNKNAYTNTTIFRDEMWKGYKTNQFFKTGFGLNSTLWARVLEITADGMIRTPAARKCGSSPSLGPPIESSPEIQLTIFFRAKTPTIPIPLDTIKEPRGCLSFLTAGL